MNNIPIIIGGGIAGLSAANYLVDHGIYPVLIEADIIGKPKVCGEFLSHKTKFYLNKWDIPFIDIQNANFITQKNSYSFKFPDPQISINRSETELLLAQRAKNMGAILMEESKVTNINNYKNINIITINNNKVLETNRLIVATGKLSFIDNKKKYNNKPNYIGIKAHFNTNQLSNNLNMFLIKNAYMGITNIDNSKINACCLVKYNLLNKFESPEKFIEHFIKSHKDLKDWLKPENKINTQWLTASVFDFGKKENPNWPNAYFIGDAAATIFPASGYGLTMGLTSGIMASKHIIENEKTIFKKKWYNKFNKKLKYAKVLNLIYLHPFLANLCFKLAILSPKIFNIYYNKIRD